MQLNRYKTKFKESLQETYPVTEIDSFFKLLAEAYLNMSRLEVAMNPGKELLVNEENQLDAARSRLLNFEPIQYILGETEFYGLAFSVNKYVLIPRPETEELVEWILQDLATKAENIPSNSQLPTSNSPLIIHHSSLKILDIGTGSGCIPVSLAKNLPQASVYGLDVSVEALKVARVNAELNQVSVELLEKDILKAQSLPEAYDVIVSNPPYVRELEKEAMHQNVLAHEPDLALYVKEADPLIFYRKIADLAHKALTKDGSLYFEINEYLKEDMQALLTETGFKEIEFKKDIFGKYRMCKARLFKKKDGL